MHRTYDVAQFQEDPHPGADLSAFVIVKGFHQLDIVTKIIERRGDRSYGLTSADKAEKRRYSNGVIFATTLNTDSFAKETCLESNPSFSCDEPFAMSYHTGELI